MTLPSVVSDLLMLAPSLSRVPLAPVESARSLPARSTRLTLLTWKHVHTSTPADIHTRTNHNEYPQCLMILWIQGILCTDICYLLRGDVSLCVLTFLWQQDRKDGVWPTAGLVHVSCSYCPANDTRVECTPIHKWVDTSSHQSSIIIPKMIDDWWDEVSTQSCRCVDSAIPVCALQT